MISAIYAAPAVKSREAIAAISIRESAVPFEDAKIMRNCRATKLPFQIAGGKRIDYISEPKAVSELTISAR
jgi:hypothetical protein